MRLLLPGGSLLLGAVLLATACGGDDESSPDTGTPPPPGDTGLPPEDTGLPPDDGGGPTPPPPPAGCLSLRGADGLAGGFERQTGAETLVSMVPAPDLGGVALEPIVGLGAFEEQTPLPQGAHDSAGWYHDGWLYDFGGQDDGPREVDTLWAAPVADDGALGAWQPGTAFSIVILDHLVNMIGGRAYFTGGGSCNASGVCRQQVASYVGDPSGGDVATWIPQPDNPHRRMGHGAAHGAGFLYTVGGDDGDVSTEDVSFAPVQPDGSLGAWATTTPTPEGGIQFLASAATSRFVYLVGGCRNKDCFRTSNIEDRVFVADIGPGGALGDWRLAATLPMRNFDPGVLVLGGRLFVTGGRPGGFGRCGDFGGDEFVDLLAADIMPDGSLGAWTDASAEGAPFPRPRSDHNAVLVYRHPYDGTGHLFVYGGRTSCVEGESDSWDLVYPPSVWRAPLVTQPGFARTGSWLSGALRPTGNATAVRIEGDGTLRLRVRSFEGGAWGPWSEPSTERSVPVSGTTLQVLVEAEGDGTSRAALRSVDVDCE